MFLLRCLVGCILWLSLSASCSSSWTRPHLPLQRWILRGAASVASTLGVPTFSHTYNEPVGWTLIGIGCFFLIIILCCCNRIRLAVAICKSAGQFVASVCTVVLVPIFQAVFAFCLWVGALVTMVCLLRRKSQHRLLHLDQQLPGPELVRFYVLVFFTLWVNAFLGA